MKLRQAILRFFITSVTQWLILFLLLYLYNYLFEIRKPDLAMGIGYHYYLTLVYPLVLVVWNGAILITSKKTVKLAIYSTLSLSIIAYWFPALCNYPYRISVLLVASIGILLINFIPLGKKKED